MNRLLISFCLLIIQSNLWGQVLIDNGDSWQYYDQANEPAEVNGKAWMDLDYNDNFWIKGSAQFGYGGNDETTLLKNNIHTAYFRKIFSLNSINPANDMMVNLTYDDGAIVYVNGIEIDRVNLPTGSVNYNTLADYSNSNEVQTFQINSDILKQGDNIIAVEIHQSSASGSDISFDLSLEGTSPNETLIVRGPYLQRATYKSMIVRWRTATPSKSVINYGTDSNNLNLSVSKNTSTTEHELEIINLQPNTTYYYEIPKTVSENVDLNSNLYFKTYPTPTDKIPLRAWVLGDCGTANTNQRNVRDAYTNLTDTLHTDMILFLGDNAYNSGTDEEYQTAIFENMYEETLKNTVAWSCLGNHDGYTAQSNSQTGPYYDIFTFPTEGESGGTASGTEAYYSFDYGNAHFIVLDSYETDRAVGSAMYNWCQYDIQNTLADWIVAIWHHPPYTKGSHDSDYEIEHLEMRENFLPMLEANGIDLVLGGHSHCYERSYLINGHYDVSSTFDTLTHIINNGEGNGKIDQDGAYNKYTNGENAELGTIYITAGSSGKKSGGTFDHPAMYYSVSQLGSCLLEIKGNQLTLQFIRETGVIEDYFTIQKDLEIDYHFQAKVALSGNYNYTTQLMTDDLRTGNHLPLTDPYNGLKTMDNSLLDVTGADAIVDWVNLEFRDKNNPSEVLFEEAFLLQRDGDLMDIDGSNSITLTSIESNFFIAIRHRNHLGAMTASTVNLNDSPILDFTNPEFITWGNHAQMNIDGTNALWAGNSRVDNRIIYKGMHNDVDPIYFEILMSPDNLVPSINYLLTGYHQTDLNLDGQVVYQGPFNEKGLLLLNVLLHPNNGAGATEFVILEQLP